MRRDGIGDDEDYGVGVESEKDAAAEELRDGGAEARKAIAGVGSLGLGIWGGRGKHS